MSLYSLCRYVVRPIFLFTMILIVGICAPPMHSQDQQLGKCHCCWRPNCPCYPCASETKCSIKNACGDERDLWKKVNSKLADPKGIGLPDGFRPPFDRLYGDDLLCRNNPNSKTSPDIGNTLGDIRQQAGIDRTGVVVDRTALRNIRDDLQKLDKELGCKEGCDNEELSRLRARMKALKEAWDAFAKQYAEDEKKADEARDKIYGPGGSLAGFFYGMGALATEGASTQFAGLMHVALEGAALVQDPDASSITSTSVMGVQTGLIFATNPADPAVFARYKADVLDRAADLSETADEFDQKVTELTDQFLEGQEALARGAEGLALAAAVWDAADKEMKLADDIYDYLEKESDAEIQTAQMDKINKEMDDIQKEIDRLTQACSSGHAKSNALEPAPFLHVNLATNLHMSFENALYPTLASTLTTPHHDWLDKDQLKKAKKNLVTSNQILSMVLDRCAHKVTPRFGSILVFEKLKSNKIFPFEMQQVLPELKQIQSHLQSVTSTATDVKQELTLANSKTQLTSRLSSSFSSIFHLPQ